MSGQREIYLDNNATTRPYPEVIEKMTAALRDAANASSAHSAGERARQLVESAREEVALLIGGFGEQVFFTSGGTEANNTVLSSLFASAPRRLVTTTIEHPSILRMAEKLEAGGIEVELVDVGPDGLVNLDHLRSALKAPTALVSIQWVNNETGVVQPINEVAAMCAAEGVRLHSDAAQAAGKVDISFNDVPIDFLTITAHKFRGPQGVGAIIARDRHRFLPLLAGGDQESGKRPGTENVPAIAGMGAAARLRTARLGEIITTLGNLRGEFERALCESLPEVKINGGEAPRVCSTTNVLFSGVDGQALLADLDRHGIRASQSSACHNQRPEPSYVLRAMGLSERDAYASIRFSLSEEVSLEDVEYATKVASDYCRNYRSTGLLRGNRA